MELKRYLDLTGLTYKDFAQKIGVHPRTVQKYVNMEQEPSASIAYKIIEQTNGRVTLKDISFYWIAKGK